MRVLLALFLACYFSAECGMGSAEFSEFRIFLVPHSAFRIPHSEQALGAQGAADSRTAVSEQELLQRIRKNRIDPSAVYQIRDVTLAREDVRFYFLDGTLALLEPLEGRVTGALFVGEGELLVMPPDVAEKRNLARFAGAPVLDEKFSNAYLRFTDDTASQLLQLLRADSAERDAGSKAPNAEQERAAGAAFVEQWNSAAQNLGPLYDLSVLAGLLSGPGQSRDPQEPRSAFFAAHVFGLRLGAFDLSVDFGRPEQVVIGQVNWKDGRRYLDLWCSFPARSVRTGAPQAGAKGDGAIQRERFSLAGARAPAGDLVRPASYRIEATIHPNRELEVSADMDFEAGAAGERLVTFELSRFLKVSSVESAGRPLVYFQNEMNDESEVRHRGNDLLAVVFPEPLEKGRRYQVRFHYSGEVISDAGRGVLFVGARGSWYPHRGFLPANFDLIFRCPRQLLLIATGERVEQREEEGWRISHWKSRQPLRVAGFNIGDYEQAKARTADGTAVEVYANRVLEPALEAQRAPAVVLELPRVPPRAPGRPPDLPLAVSVPPAPPTPSQVASQMAREAAQALDFFIRSFGPLPSGRVAISPIPGTFGQGWPGLVYLSTSAFSLPFDSARRPMSRTEDLYFRTLLRDHELAHQWWGQLVAPASYRDEWITEALSSYAALLWLEQQGRNGQNQMRLVLDRYRQDLLAKRGEETAEAAGPPVLGSRLASSRSPDGRSAILYKKGPWIIHMLRQLMRDPRNGSDAAFFRFLRALRDEFSARPVTTAGFRAVAEKFVVPDSNADSGSSLEWFFDQWVYGTGVPEVRIKATVKVLSAGSGRKTRAEVSGAAALAGVDQSWILPVPIYVETAGGDVFAGTVTAGSEESRFRFPLGVASERAVADPRQTLLAVWR